MGGIESSAKKFANNSILKNKNLKNYGNFMNSIFACGKISLLLKPPLQICVSI